MGGAGREPKLGLHNYYVTESTSEAAAAFDPLGLTENAALALFVEKGERLAEAVLR